MFEVKLIGSIKFIEEVNPEWTPLGLEIHRQWLERAPKARDASVSDIHIATLQGIPSKFLPLESQKQTNRHVRLPDDMMRSGDPLTLRWFTWKPPPEPVRDHWPWHFVVSIGSSLQKGEPLAGKEVSVRSADVPLEIASMVSFKQDVVKDKLEVVWRERKDGSYFVMKSEKGRSITVSGWKKRGLFSFGKDRQIRILDKFKMVGQEGGQVVWKTVDHPITAVGSKKPQAGVRAGLQSGSTSQKSLKVSLPLRAG